MTKPRPLDRIRTGTFSRGFALARVSAQAGAKAAGHVLGNLFSNEEARAENLRKLLLTQVTLLTEQLGQLKGSLMKVGQLLSMYGEHIFPAEINAVLKSLQSQAPPLEWKAIETVLRKQLGDKMLGLEIDPVAIASASLGQVHRAVIKKEQISLALKIQYPGVDRAIDSDLKSLRRILRMSKLLPAQGALTSVDELFAEVRQMLHHEVDFMRELEFTDRFRELLSDDPRYRVAKTFPEFSTRRVLATELLEGVPLDSPEIRNLSQDRRNALAQAALDLYFREVFVLGIVQTDPHFGNYCVQLGDGEKPDRLVLFDFGAVRTFPDRFLKPYRRMVRATFQKDFEAHVDSATELGFLEKDDPQELKQTFVDICALFLEPFEDAQGVYDWGATDLPRRLARLGAKYAVAVRLRPPPREVVFLDRKMGGIFILLSSLGARIRTRELLEHYLTN